MCLICLPLLVSELLKHKGDPSATVASSGDSALHIAIKLDHRSCISAILAYESSSRLAEVLDKKNSDGLTPLGVSLSMKNFELATILVQSKFAKVECFEFSILYLTSGIYL